MMITRLYGLQCYNASSVSKVRDLELQGALGKISSIKNTPLVISTTPIKYDELPSSKEILKENKRGCFSSLLKRLAPKTPDSDVLKAPVEFVKKHPKMTIATGMITTVIGSITANVPAIGIGMTLIAAGALAQASNRHAEKQTNNPEAQISPEIAS